MRLTSYPSSGLSFTAVNLQSPARLESPSEYLEIGRPRLEDLCTAIQARAALPVAPLYSVIES
jgi:hypothetical protein